MSTGLDIGPNGRTYRKKSRVELQIHEGSTRVVTYLQVLIIVN